VSAQRCQDDKEAGQASDSPKLSDPQASDPQAAVHFVSGRPTANIPIIRYFDSRAIEFSPSHINSDSLALAKNLNLAAKNSSLVKPRNLDGTDLLHGFSERRQPPLTFLQLEYSSVIAGFEELK
jgi:hypothetical protein